MFDQSGGGGTRSNGRESSSTPLSWNMLSVVNQTDCYLLCDVGSSRGGNATLLHQRSNIVYILTVACNMSLHSILPTQTCRLEIHVHKNM